MEPLPFLEEDGGTRDDGWTKRSGEWDAVGVLMDEPIRDEMAFLGSTDEANCRMMPTIGK